ncbi:MAG: hypothetical protein ATN34_05475 [Epulopiscium sp. Nele67-Bin002]|nr:MAG: hypothetical protein BEN18_03680 [Epulopiscium sp. Nuni2H_MBin001]OON91485.1 MAG: hypothetical protein ATN34_05475 [Epulopiscium sp. Nele67-Bin002]OON93476.1 MAG: hypothetical protein ATN33_05710 [Epulopiscium sp. Nele67-Bin001]
MQVIYIDTLFIVNLVMDIFIFITASLLLSQKLDLKRIFISAFLAASLYCITLIIPELQTLPLNLYYVILPCMPIIYLFRPNTITKFFKVYLVNIMSASMIGGIAFSVYYQSAWYMGKQPSILIPFLCGGGVSLLVYSCLTFIRKKILLLHCEAKISFVLSGEKITLEGIVDTGNTLYTPFSKQPVTVVSMDKIDKFLCSEIKEFISDLETSENLADMMAKTSSSLQLIPFRSVGCTNGMIAAIRVDDVTISRGDYTYSHDDIMVGITKNHVFKDDSYSVLIHPDLVN